MREWSARWLYILTGWRRPGRYAAVSRLRREADGNLEARLREYQ